ncbi:MAG TPA: asparagine synthase (glutamine-hydrolyzing) [Polyangia bacterium]|nr:asparagine synthase (glutamine-hydrolyzing) [Polyangia bacterium]
MCGIAGVVDASGAWLDAGALEAMRESMHARGPDDAGTFADGAAMLAFRRLSILDLAGGHQPMATPEGDCVVVFNGEIYNHASLRERLGGLGHAFVTRSDTECILHAYRQWGDACVAELDGMFAFALWDTRARRLLLARDRFGKKPLYYYADGARLAFASTLTALLAHPAVPRAIDRDALAEYLALEYVVAPRTILAGVCKLPPATLLSFDADGHPRERRYWTLRVDGGARSTAARGRAAVDAAAVDLEALLQSAVRRRLVADVPLGIFLSGGVDSSTVAALAARERAGIETFSVAFADPSFDERTHARAVAAHLGTRHHEEELSLAEAARIVGELGSILDEPVADGSIVPTYLLSRFARRHVTVALGGDGADELFAGYPTHVAHRLLAWAGPLGRPPLMRAAAVLAARLPVSLDNFSFDFRVKKLTAGGAASDDERNYRWLGAFEPARLAALMGDDGDGVARDPFAAVRARYHEPPAGTHLERVLYQDVGLYLTHSVLAKVDRASMAASLEVRAPFLDTAVAEFAAALPLDWKLRRTTGKWILKRMARKLLPRAIVDRPKKGFGMPIARWLRGELSDLCRDALLDGDSLAAAGALRRGELERLLDEHARGAVDHRQRLWALLVLELWQRKNLKQATNAADRRRASTR